MKDRNRKMFLTEQIHHFYSQKETIYKKPFYSFSRMVKVDAHVCG